MKRSISLSMVMVLCGVVGVVENAWAAKPNIIVFYTDDHGYADLSCQGVLDDVKTPNIDALAQQGVVAKHGYSTAPQCVPSRAGLLVGKFQGRFNLDANGGSLAGFDKETTFASRLQKVGYVTAQFGKWHLGPTAAIPMHGFTYSFSQNNQSPFSANITLDGQDRPMSNLQPESYHIDGCSRAAASVIERHKNDPFFLYVAYRAPHTPLDAPKKYTDRFPGKMPERRRQALGMISAIDDGVGLIQETLRKHQLTDRTLIFLIGDNGAPLKIHKVDSPLNGDAGGWDGSLNTPLNGEKGMLSEGGIHVPFVIAWPGTIPGGQAYQHPISALDVAATAVAAASIPTKPVELDGVNLVPYLQGKITTPPHEALYWRWVAQSAIREGNWKLLRGGDREYLYDLGTDLEEKHNIASKYPEVASRLRAKLRAWGADLLPPGISLAPMAATWIDYFDYYLGGKTVNGPPGSKGTIAKLEASEVQVWQVRNGKITLKDKEIVISQEKSSQSPFLVRSQLQLQGPLTANITLKASANGAVAMAWRMEGDKDFLPSNTAASDVIGVGEWQAHQIKLPSKGTIIHVRLRLPHGVSQLRHFELKNAQGATVLVLGPQ